MTIEKLLTTAPLFVIDEFLPDDEAAECFAECVMLRPFFFGASVGQGAHNRIDHSIRENGVVMLDTLYAGVRENSPLLNYIGKRIESPEYNRLWHRGYSIFDNINYANYHESVLSRYGTGNHYERHQDTKFRADTNEELRNRMVTLIYYVQREPAAFTGGELTVYPEEDEAPATIAPVHNRAVVFPSFMWHSVGAVRLENDAHENGRFSLNRWMGFR